MADDGKIRKHMIRELNWHYAVAADIALKVVERDARKILIRNPHLGEFILGMGVWHFTRQDGEIQDERKYMAALSDFIGEWDRYLYLTGCPMRFTANGPVITDW